MSVNLSPFAGAGAQFFTDAGTPLTGGLLYTYAAGTTTPLTTYTDSAGTVANSNPIVLNSAGRVPYEIWLSAGNNYKFVLKTATSTTIGTWDNIRGVNDPTGQNFYADVFTATADQTVFTLTTNPGSVNALLVSLDGAVLNGGSDFTWTGTTLTLTVGAYAGQVLRVGYSAALTTAIVPDGSVVNASVAVGANIDSDKLAYQSTATGAVSRTVEAKLGDVVSVKDFGAVGDGVTNDSAAFTLALAAAANRTLYVPAGTYKLSLTSGALFSPPANISIQGEGSEVTTFIFTPTSTTYSALFNLINAGFSIRNVKITASVPSGGIVAFIQQAADNIEIVDCTLDGAVTWTGSAVSHSAYGLIAAAIGANSDGLLVEHCKITRLTYPYLKSNTSTTSQTRLKWVNNNFTANYYNDLGLNSPSGVCDDVLISGNRFGNNQSIGTVGASQALGIALASVTNFKIIGNTFSDNYTDAIHIEEGSYYGAIEGNTAYINGTALAFLANNVGGSAKSPTYIAVTGNSFSKSGTLKSVGSYGIQYVQNASGYLPGYNIQITGNVISGFERGLYGSSTLDDSIAASGNVIYQCAKGISVQDGAGDINNNTTNSCDVGIAGIVAGYLYESACIVDHTFINCTTNVDSIDLPITLLGPRFIFPEFNHAGGGTNVYKACLALGANDRVNGFMEITEDCNTAIDYSRIRDEINWDGTTFTRTNKLTIQPGGVNTLSANNGGNLCVQVFAIGARTNVRVQARINGMAVVAV